MTTTADRTPTSAYNSTYGLRTAGPTQGMDEDYDACDLENWFLAIQSADGQVMIPSFHRPAIIRYDPNAARSSTIGTDLGSSDTRTVRQHGQSRLGVADPPPVAADGHDAATFPDLVPDRPPARSPTTSTTTATASPTRSGSTWAIRPAATRQGQLYKPLFAFMVIGLNGRIPLNTAGNLADTAGISSAGNRSRTPRRRGTPCTSATRSARSTRPTRSRTPSIDSTHDRP